MLASDRQVAPGLRPRLRDLPAGVPPRALAALASLALLFGCGEGQKQQVVLPPPKVTVARPVQRTIVDHDEYVGRFVAVESVEIRARVSGYLAKVHFQDGQYVKQGDLLFTVDRRRSRTRSIKPPPISRPRSRT